MPLLDWPFVPRAHLNDVYDAVRVCETVAGTRAMTRSAAGPDTPR